MHLVRRGCAPNHNRYHVPENDARRRSVVVNIVPTPLQPRATTAIAIATASSAAVETCTSKRAMADDDEDAEW
jgi:hypothetical protein